MPGLDLAKGIFGTFLREDSSPEITPNPVARGRFELPSAGNSYPTLRDPEPTRSAPKVWPNTRPCYARPLHHRATKATPTPVAAIRGFQREPDLPYILVEMVKYTMARPLSLFGLTASTNDSQPADRTNLLPSDQEKNQITPTATVGSKPAKIHVCPECGSLNLIEDYDQGETICQDCGLVLSQNAMSRGPEWRAFTKEEKDERGRVGIPTSFSIHDKGLSTVIDRVNRDAYGRQLPVETRMEMLRLRKWQIRTRVHSSADRNLAQAMAELDRLTDRLHVPPNVKEDAAVVYRKALDSGLVRGRSIAAIAAASLYAACRSSETPRTLKEVASASRIKKKDVARCYRLLLRELEMSMPVEDPIRCISKIASRAEISMQTQQSAIKVLKDARKKGVVAGKDPMGLAAAALYVACVLTGEKKTQKQISEIANVTEVTVRNRYKGLREALGLSA